MKPAGHGEVQTSTGSGITVVSIATPEPTTGHNERFATQVLPPEGDGHLTGAVVGQMVGSTELQDHNVATQRPDGQRNGVDEVMSHCAAIGHCSRVF